MGQYTSFIVRVWMDEHGSLSGSIEHAATREAQGFRDLAAIARFIVAHLEIQNPTRSKEQQESGDENRDRMT